MKVLSIEVHPIIGQDVKDLARDLIDLAQELDCQVFAKANGKQIYAHAGDTIPYVLRDYYPPTPNSPDCINLRLTPKNHFYGNWLCERKEGKWRAWNSMGGRREMCGPPPDWDTNWEIERIP